MRLKAAGLLRLAGCTLRAGRRLPGVLRSLDALAKLAAAPRRGAHPATTLAAFAALTSAAATASITSVSTDRTSRDGFPDGRTSISPRVNIDLKIEPDERPQLTRLIDNFAATHELSFRKSSRSEMPDARSLYLNLRNERGTTISVAERYWHDSTYARPRADRGVSIPIYALYAGSDWQELAKDLIADLETMWPGRVRFRGRDGRIIPKPLALSFGQPAKQLR